VIEVGHPGHQLTRAIKLPTIVLMFVFSYSGIVRPTGFAAELRAVGPSVLAAGSAAAGGQHAARSREPRSPDRLRSGELLSILVCHA
jgi:hypothetical protein